jgi:hypothetical protein
LKEEGRRKKEGGRRGRFMGNWKIGRPPYLLSTAFGSLCPLMAEANSNIVQQLLRLINGTPRTQKQILERETSQNMHVHNCLCSINVAKQIHKKKQKLWNEYTKFNQVIDGYNSIIIFYPLIRSTQNQPTHTNRPT